MGKSIEAGTYILTDPTVGLVLENGRHVAYTLESGMAVLVTNESFNGTSFVNVIWAGLAALMFVEDLKARTVRVATK
jgi:hypothetical protein